jgi:nucleoside-diphosphate-sugar epimerase
VVAEARRRGHTVRVAARPSQQPAPGFWGAEAEVEVVRLDLREPQGLAAGLYGMDAVIHCAAAMSGDLAAQRAITVEGTRHLLAAMGEAGVRHIVGLSTFALYDYHAMAAGSLLDEDAPLETRFDQRGPYILAKREQEDLIRERSGAAGWRWTILRPGIVFGPGRTWFHQLGMQLRPARWVCLADDSLLPLSYVENCAEAVVAALGTEVANGVTLNIVDDDLPERGRYVQALAARTDPRPKITDIPWAWLERAARTAEWTNRALLLGRVPLPGLLQPASLDARSKPLRYSNARARHALGWTPRWNLAEGLERSFGGG